MCIRDRLDPFEKEFHLPATAVQLGDGQGRKVEIVGEENEQLVVLGIVELHPTQMDWVTPVSYTHLDVYKRQV